MSWQSGEYGNPDQVVIKGGKWGKETPLSYLDIAEMKGHQTPGPVWCSILLPACARYMAHEILPWIASAVRRRAHGRLMFTRRIFLQGAYEEPQKGAKGGRFNMSRPKTFLEALEYASKGIPGIILRFPLSQIQLTRYSVVCL